MATVKDGAPCRGFGNIDELSVDIEGILVARAATSGVQSPRSPSHTVGCQESASTLPSSGSAFHLQGQCVCVNVPAASCRLPDLTPAMRVYLLTDDEEFGKPFTTPMKQGCFEKLPKRVQELVTDGDWESLWCGCAFFSLALLLGLSGAFEGTSTASNTAQRSFLSDESVTLANWN
jgi:hypothetical protein